MAVGLNVDFLGLYRALSPNIYWGGEQASWWGPMAIAVIVGILFATFLTLFLVPVVYSLVDDFTKFFNRYYRSQPQESAATAEASRVPAERAAARERESAEEGVPAGVAFRTSS